MADQELSREQLLEELSRLRRENSEYRKQIERLREAANKAELMFERLFGAMNSGVAVYDVIGDGEDFVFKDINPAGERIARTKRDQLVGCSVTSAFPGIHETGLFELFRKVWKSGQPEFCHAHRYHDERLDVWTEDHVLRLPSGEIVQIHSDVTDRKLTQQALEKSEQRYRTLVERATEEICLLDDRGTFLFANARIAEYFDLTPGDFTGKTLWDFFPQDIADGKMAVVREVLATGRGCTVELPSEINGKAHWYEATAVPLPDETQQLYAVMVIARNITELKETRDELNLYREEMARAERLASTGTLSAMVAHELAQPLTVIRLSIQHALSSLKESTGATNAYEGLKDSLAEVNNVASIVARFRAFAQETLERREGYVDIAPLIHKTCRLMEAASCEAQVTIIPEGLETLPKVYACEKDLEQLFFILIENSLQASDRLRDHQLTIQGRSLDRLVELRFSDDCGGIKPEHVDRLFEPFFSTKPRDRSTGLGLCIAERIVAESQGTVSVDNRPDEGATFVVTLAQNPG